MQVMFRQLPVFFGFLIAAEAAQAQLAQNLLIGNAKALSLGNAVTADPPGIDSVHYNPAGLSRLEGSQRQLKLILADVSIEGEFTTTPEYEDFVDNYPFLGKDSAANTKSSVEKFAIYLPGKGVQELPFIAAPLGGASYQPPDSALTFGTAVYAPLILGFVRDENDPGRFYGEEMGLSRITYFSPTVSWEYSDTLSFGFGVGFSYFGAALKLDYRAANALLAGLTGLVEGQCESDNVIAIDVCKGNISPFEEVFTLEADLNEPMSPTVNLGMLWHPYNWLTVGMVYQSESSDRLKGDIAVNLNPDVVNFIDGLDDRTSTNDGVKTVEDNKLLLALLGLDLNKGNIDSTGYMDLTMPQHFAAGVSVQVTPDWKVNVDYKWTETSVWDEFAFYFDENIQVLQVLSLVGINGVQPNALIIPRGYEDASNFAFGVEYRYSDSLALRAGYEPRKSGIPKDKLDFLIPLGDFDLYGVGFEYKLSPSQIVDVALGYAKSDQKIPSGSSTNGNSAILDNFVYNPSAGLDVRSTLEATLLEFSYLSRF